jgi:hypothetical protein
MNRIITPMLYLAICTSRYLMFCTEDRMGVKSSSCWRRHHVLRKLKATRVVHWVQSLAQAITAQDEA